MQIEPRNYASYLLRLRQIEQDGLLVWRATLESIQTGKRENFVDAQALADFLLDGFGTMTIGAAGDDRVSEDAAGTPIAPLADRVEGLTPMPGP